MTETRFAVGDRVYIISMDQTCGTFVRYSRREGYGLGELAEVDVDNHLSNVLVPVDRLALLDTSIDAARSGY